MKGMAQFGGNMKSLFGRRKKKNSNQVDMVFENVEQDVKRDSSFDSSDSVVNSNNKPSGTFDAKIAGALDSNALSGKTGKLGFDMTFDHDKIKGDAKASVLADAVKQDAKNKALHAKLTNLTKTDETGKYLDQAAYDKHMSGVGGKNHTRKVVDKANDPNVLNKNQGGSREIYTPIATDTRENATNQNMVNKASNNKSVTQNYNSPTTKLSLQDYHQSQLDKAANKPNPKEEAPQYLSSNTESGFTEKKGYREGKWGKSGAQSGGKSSSGTEADISSVVSDIKGFGGKKDYFKK
jgi:hypothetical protein